MKVAIAGYALEGRVNYQYWLSLGHDVTIVDERVLPADELPENVATLMGEGVLGNLQGFDLVVRTASLNPEKIKTDGKIWSATNEFFDKCPADIIGVTGTKGKGTTSSLIASILEAADRTVHLVGNIGTSALEVLPSIKPDDIVVFELSSFQLWDIEKSPHIAVVLMIEADHLDIHPDMQDYLSAKANIRKHQAGSDVCFYHPTNEFASEIALIQPGAKRYGVPEDGAVYVKENTFFVRDDPICSTDSLQIPGEHNRENACAAISAALVYGVEYAAIETGLRNFTGLPHRLKLVGEINGVRFYDDSIATTPGSAIAALRSFSEPKLIILGGSEKGATYESVVEVCKQTGAKVIAIGQTGTQIAKLCADSGVEVVELGQASMSEIVAVASKRADPGTVVILSPASASFDMFKSYSDRGDQFIAAVNSLLLK
jgi:UDP-N-acetylmuramoylalanine--D-glutamate ligase